MTGTVVVFSGGMDSTVLLTRATRLYPSVRAVSFDYGQRHGKSELRAATTITEQLKVPHHVVDVSTLATHLPGSALTDDTVAVPDGHYAEDTMKATVVPNRNLIMLSIAAGIAQAHDCDHVETAVHSGDHAVYPDCRPDFTMAARTAIELGTGGTVTLDAPFVNISKTDIAALGAELMAPMGLSWSCYKGGDTHCGACGTCWERREAMRDAGLFDPTPYLATPEYAAPA